MKNLQGDIKESKERCIICGAETEYGFDTLIDKRLCYIEGVGQLCPKCYYNLCAQDND